MKNKQNKPVIFLAFANDRGDTIGYLRDLPEEARRLRDVLEPAERAGLCEVLVRPNCTAAEIFKVFQDSRYRNRVAIFHYGGHANSYKLVLESTTGQPAYADAGGFAAFLAQQKGLQLVFLNGCSTRLQNQGLHNANISVVISTSRAIVDSVAVDFASQFYQGLAGGASIREAFGDAEASITMVNGKTRSLYFGKKLYKGFPWRLASRKGYETADQWTLPKAVEDPLYGLPPLPRQDLPDSPYRHLNWFTRKEAEIFFGRGHQIRELYERLTSDDSAPIVLYYGQSGVGKSSILDAGLIPRMERDYEIRYLRRDKEGLLDTLNAAIQLDSSSKQKVSAWHDKEEQTGKPLIVILDQVEECYTRPNEHRPDELDRFLAVIKKTFGDGGRRPRGKLVLGFRKEWLAELESKLSAHNLTVAKVFLQPLDRRGIIEAVTGPCDSERLKKHYGLTIDEGLAETIAVDLLSDSGSAIAPTLQVLLAKFWQRAKSENYEQPRFCLEMYRDLKRNGILLSDFLNQQISTLGGVFLEVVESGLLLDILAFHTTSLGTADQKSESELREEYKHVAHLLPQILEQCQTLYLLTRPVGTRHEIPKEMRLVHDTLAPLVRQIYNQSDKPGQRARQILDSITRRIGTNGPDWRLDEFDLATVEAGISGTRAWTIREQQLIEASRSTVAQSLAQRAELLSNSLEPLKLTESFQCARRSARLDRSFLPLVRSLAPVVPAGEPLVHEAPIRSVLFHPDRNELLSFTKQGSHPYVAHLWDLETRKVIKSIPSIVEPSSIVEFGWVKTQAFLMQYGVNDIDNNTTLFQWKSCFKSPCAVHSTRRLIAYAFGKRCQVVDMGTGETILSTRLPRMLNWIESLCFNGNGARLLLTGMYATSLLSVDTGEEIGRINADAEYSWLSPLGNAFAVLDNAGTIRIWSEVGPIVDVNISDFSDFAFSPDGRSFMLADLRGKIAIHETHTGSLLHEFKIASSIPNPDDNLPRFIYAQLKLVARKFKLSFFDKLFRDKVWVSFSNTGNWAIAGGTSSSITIWDVHSGRLVKAINIASSQPIPAKVCASDRHIAVVSQPNTVQTYRVMSFADENELIGREESPI